MADSLGVCTILFIVLGWMPIGSQSFVALATPVHCAVQDSLPLPHFIVCLPALKPI